ncbi:sperm acrosome-associated protein 7 [Peromyscus leucopus]|uniref:sperm acrosome-associated protein 7 n=1 Tax=Peromyscus leucopus TaxID=10041 RepID=UPI0010A10C25|nr:sperm acrosome-associated protein 7 [Peromyscus leucopus]
MAATRGVVETFLSVFLLCCWRGAELQPVNKTSGPVTDDSFNSTNEEMPEVFDEIIAQEILEPNTSASNETPTTKRTTRTTKPTKEKNSGIDDNYQEDSSENYHEVVENSELSSLNKEKFESNDRSTAENLHDHKLEPHFSSEERKSSSSDNFGKVSVLDRILQNIGRPEGGLDLTESIF